MWKCETKAFNSFIDNWTADMMSQTMNLYIKFAFWEKTQKYFLHSDPSYTDGFKTARQWIEFVFRQRIKYEQKKGGNQDLLVVKFPFHYEFRVIDVDMQDESVAKKFRQEVLLDIEQIIGSITDELLPSLRIQKNRTGTFNLSCLEFGKFLYTLSDGAGFPSKRLNDFLACALDYVANSTDIKDHALMRPLFQLVSTFNPPKFVEEHQKSLFLTKKRVRGKFERLYGYSQFLKFSTKNDISNSLILECLTYYNQLVVKFFQKGCLTRNLLFVDSRIAELQLKQGTKQALSRRFVYDVAAKAASELIEICPSALRLDFVQNTMLAYHAEHYLELLENENNKAPDSKIFKDGIFTVRHNEIMNHFVPFHVSKYSSNYSRLTFNAQIRLANLAKVCLTDKSESIEIKDRCIRWLNQLNSISFDEIIDLYKIANQVSGEQEGIALNKDLRKNFLKCILHRVDEYKRMIKFVFTEEFLSDRLKSS
jgi:hypothetical protein